MSQVRFVVTLHGLGRSSASMAPLSAFLRRSRPNVINYGYPSRHLSIEAQVARLETALHCRVPPGAVVDFVGHSLGGIIARWLCTRRDHHWSPGRLVMLGSPNQGSSLAALVTRTVPGAHLLLGPALKQLCTLAIPALPTEVEVGIIAGARARVGRFSPLVSGPNDGIVSVAETTLPGARDHLTVPVIHTLLMLSPEVMRQVLSFLDRGHFSRQ